MAIKGIKAPPASAGGIIAPLPVLSGRLSECVRFVLPDITDGGCRVEAPERAEMVDLIVRNTGDDPAALWVAIDDGSRDDLPEDDGDLLAWLTENGRPIFLRPRAGGERILRVEAGDTLLLGFDGAVDFYGLWQIAS